MTNAALLRCTSNDAFSLKLDLRLIDIGALVVGGFYQVIGEIQDVREHQKVLCASIMSSAEGMDTTLFERAILMLRSYS